MFQNFFIQETDSVTPAHITVLFFVVLFLFFVVLLFCFCFLLFCFVLLVCLVFISSYNI